ncbi:MAG: PspA/IM30 family protein, partial [Gammaproteobacteria bacterium]|nr:PspA/IM30 family protein [Gammaproteobacteria bacterium]
KSMKTEIKTVKATEYAQQAAIEASAKYSGASSDTSKAAERLRRIKENQAHRQAKMEVARELEQATNGDELKTKLAAAGIGESRPGREDIMARIRNRRG